jgi:glycosyltransferase involved in cell wall biosynthesis
VQQVRRVLFIQTQGENAGAQEISRLIGAGLTARGYDVQHLFFYRKSKSFDAPPNTSYCITERPRNPLDALRFLRTLAKKIRYARPDVILPFQHYGNTVGGAMARLVSPAPIIANQVSPRMTMNWLVRQADLVLGLLGTFRLITVNSHGMLEEYSRYPAPYSKRLIYIPHGFDHRVSTLSKAAARQSFGLPVDVALLGSVARLHPIKRLDAAIRLLRDRPDLHLALAGQGPQEQQLRQLAAEINATDRVYFVGEMPPERIGDFLASLDLFVFPSHAETFGLAAVEAAGAGVPVVANDLSVLREVMSYDGKPAAFFADAADDEKLTDAVSRVMTDRMLREELIASGKGLRMRYSVERMIDEYDRILKDLHMPDVQRVAPA